jgi:hypothetical protein
MKQFGKQQQSLLLLQREASKFPHSVFAASSMRSGNNCDTRFHLCSGNWAAALLLRSNLIQVTQSGEEQLAAPCEKDDRFVILTGVTTTSTPAAMLLAAPPLMHPLPKDVTVELSGLRDLLLQHNKVVMVNCTAETSLQKATFFVVVAPASLHALLLHEGGEFLCR